MPRLQREELMPFKSKAQMRFAFGTGQEWAQKWANATKHPDQLPNRLRPTPPKPKPKGK